MEFSLRALARISAPASPNAFEFTLHVCKFASDCVYYVEIINNFALYEVCTYEISMTGTFPVMISARTCTPGGSDSRCRKLVTRLCMHVEKNT